MYVRLFWWLAGLLVAVVFANVTPAAAQSPANPAPSPANTGPAALDTRTDTGVRITPFGRVRLDVAFDTRRMRRQESIDLVAPHDTNDESEFWISGNFTRLGLAMEVPWMREHGVATVIEIDFANTRLDGVTAEAFEPLLRLRRAEVLLPVTRWFRIDAGYGADIVAPMQPDILDGFRGFGSGDIGFRHARIGLRFGRDARVHPGATIHMPALFEYESNDLDDWIGFSIAVVDPIANPLATRDSDGLDGDDGRDSGKPVLHGRLTFGPAPTTRDPLRRQPEVGLSGAIGWQLITESVGAGLFARTVRTAWIAAFDARVPLPFDLTLSVEMWSGSNTDFVGGGMLLPGIDVDTLGAVDAHGGWIQLVWQSADITVPRIRVAVAFGLDDPSSIDLYQGQGAGQVGGADRIQFLVGTLMIMPAPNLVIGIEVSWWKAEYFGTNNNESLRSLVSLQLDF